MQARERRLDEAEPIRPLAIEGSLEPHELLSPGAGDDPLAPGRGSDFAGVGIAGGTGACLEPQRRARQNDERYTIGIEVQSPRRTRRRHDIDRTRGAKGHWRTTRVVWGLFD